MNNDIEQNAKEVVSETSSNEEAKASEESNFAIEQKIKKVIAETLNKEEAKISEGTSFVEDLGADSLDQVELMMALEAAFHCNIPDDDASKIRTVKDAIDYIKQKQEEVK